MKVVIVGGGIGGLYASLHLSKIFDVILLDDRDYVGGRIHTHKNPQYEIGALRFRKNHVLVNSLVKRYNLKKYRLENKRQYVDGKTTLVVPYSTEFFRNGIQKTLQYSKKDICKWRRGVSGPSGHKSL